MTKYYQNIGLWLLLSLLITACSKDGADGNDVTKPNEEAKEIRFNADVWKMAEATRATTFDNAAALQGEGFTCTAYDANTATPNEYAGINAESVTWSGSRWVIADGPHHWPTSGNLDFFAYMPKAGSLPSYITAGPTYTATSSPSVTHDVTFTCTSLPMTNAGQGSGLNEFIYAMTLGQNKDNAGAGVNLTFQHPFARIILQFSNSQENIQINTITLKNIKNNGSYTHSSGWTPSGDATNLVLTFEGNAANFDANEEIGTYLMIPQEWTGGIDVNATWNVWGESQTKTVSTTLSSITWQRGNSYTYTFTVTPTDLTVNTSKFTEQW